MPLGTEEGLGPGHIVLDGDPAAPPPQKKKKTRGGGRAPCPIFGPFLLWPNGWMHQDATGYGGRPQPRGLCLAWAPSPLPKRGRSPTVFRPYFCGQMGAWIKMPLGTEVGRGLGHIVLDRDPAPLP